MERRTYEIRKADVPVAIQRISWSFEKTGRLIVETMDIDFNLQSKERISLNVSTRSNNSDGSFPLFSIHDGWKSAFNTLFCDEMIAFGSHVSTFFLPLFYDPEKDNRIFAQDTSELFPFFAKIVETGDQNRIKYKTIMPESSYRYYDANGILIEMHTKEYHVEVIDESC